MLIWWSYLMLHFMLGNFMWNCLSLFPSVPLSLIVDWVSSMAQEPSLQPLRALLKCAAFFYTRLLSSFLIPTVQKNFNFFFKIHATSKPPHQWKLNSSMTPKVSICAMIGKAQLGKKLLFLFLFLSSSEQAVRMPKVQLYPCLFRLGGATFCSSFGPGLRTSFSRSLS